MGKLIPQLVTASELSRALAERRLSFSAGRLTELADAQYIPHVRSEDGKPVFEKAKAIQWVWEKLVQKCEARHFPIEVAVFKFETGVGMRPGVPAELEMVADHVRQFPLRSLSIGPCVYFLLRDHEIVYVGKAENLAMRLLQHLKVKTFDRVLFISCAQEEMSRLERAFIWALKPLLNGESKQPRPSLYDPEWIISRFREGKSVLWTDEQLEWCDWVI